MPLSDIIPLLLEKQRGRTAARQKQQRVNEMTRNFILLQSGEDIANLGGPPSEELRTRATRAQAFFGLASRGVNLPQSFLEPKKQVDWEGIYKDFKVNEKLANLHRTGAIQDQPFVRLLVDKGDPTKLSDERLAEILPFFPDAQVKTVEQFRAIEDAQKELGTATFLRFFAGDDPKLEEQADATQLAEITDLIDSTPGIKFTDLSGRQQTFMADKFSAASLKLMFRKEYSAEQLLTLGYERVLLEKEGQLGPPWLSSGRQAKILAGETEGFTQEQIDWVHTALDRNGNVNNDYALKLATEIADDFETLAENVLRDPVAIELTEHAKAFMKRSITLGYSKEQLRAIWKKMKAEGTASVNLTDQDVEDVIAVYPERSDGN